MPRLRVAGHSRFRMFVLSPLRVGPMRLNRQVTWHPPEVDSLERRLPVLDQVPRGAEYRALAVRSALNSPEATHMGFWSINPYIGCEFGCTYCYARDTHRYAVERAVTESASPGASRLTSLPATESFERHILVKQHLGHILCRTLDPARTGNTPIVIGTATDPYQPAERRFGVTQGVLHALARFSGLHLGIITKSPLILRDIPLLQRLAQRHTLKVHISLASTSRALLRRLEARSPAPAARLRALRSLNAAGIDAGLLVAPVVPLLTDSRAALHHLFQAGVNAGARRIHAQPLRLGTTARQLFLAQLTREFPNLVVRYERHFARSSNAEARYCQALRRRIRGLQKEFGLVPASWEEDPGMRSEPEPVVHAEPSRQLGLL